MVGILVDFSKSYTPTNKSSRSTSWVFQVLHAAIQILLSCKVLESVAGWPATHGTTRSVRLTVNPYCINSSGRKVYCINSSGRKVYCINSSGRKVYYIIASSMETYCPSSGPIGIPTAIIKHSMKVDRPRMTSSRNPSVRPTHIPYKMTLGLNPR